MAAFDYVDDLHGLEDLGSILQADQLIGLDTEFMREKTYYAQLCLVQLNTGHHIYCADPLADMELAPFWQKLMQCQLVVHSGRQDIEVLYQTANCMPSHIFDTQIGAAFLGHAPQMGYANLVKTLFSVELPKSHTRADWSKRPLQQAVLEYAAEDVEYLLPAYEILTEQLRELGRLNWALEDSAAMLDRSLYASEHGTAINRVKGARNLSGSARSIAEVLAEWRERRAETRNRPRQWIMKDTVLLELAIDQPRSLSALGAVEGMSEGTLQRQGQQLLQIIKEPGVATDYEPPQRPDEADKALLKVLAARVAIIAKDLNVAAEILAPRKELADAICGERASRVFSGWRQQVVGDQLLELLEN